MSQRHIVSASAIVISSGLAGQDCIGTNAQQVQDAPSGLVPALVVHIGRMRVGVGHHLVSMAMAMAADRHHYVCVHMVRCSRNFPELEMAF